MRGKTLISAWRHKRRTVVGRLVIFSGLVDLLEAEISDEVSWTFQRILTIPAQLDLAVFVRV